ncbi:receptor-like protein EIX2 [Bidens hawaiensis]|uniref:receptor-like protein EIX2 n=1 Tax=Bidens hawaiensis TaxID=980011 RepID=UPI00404B8CCB
MFVFVSLLLCMGSFINGGLTSRYKEDTGMMVTRSCYDEERQALLGLKANLVDINNTLNDWGHKEKNDCCQWTGVGCDVHTGHVTQLDLSSSYGYVLSGNISSLLSLLPRLEYLDLSGIDFQFNNIPNSLSSLTDLRYLKISNANLSGSIPHQLANLSNLLILDLSNNFLSGPIPDSLGDLTSLTEIHLSTNRLEGVIPTSFGNLPRLIELDLSRNLLNGSVPDFVRSTFLRQLDLSRNKLTGNLPNSTGKLSNLRYLDVSSNSLTGVIYDVHFQTLDVLIYLDLSFNSFELNLSSNIGFKLLTIKLQSCKLGPTFPMWIQTQRQFAYLDISNAGISDHVPGWFWDLPPRLRFLNLSSNDIKGMLPDMALFFEDYPGMDLSNNKLEGMIPLLPSKLAALNLSRNRFSGTLSFLCRIDAALTFLDLSSNLLSGNLPDCLKKFYKRLVVLNLSNNSLSGEIPSSLGFLSELQALYLRRNAFVGEVPTSLNNYTKLRFVDLGENKFSGNIPAWIEETLSELYALVLRSNRFNGSLPSQICFLNNLQLLDLSNNMLVGNIPRCFGNFTAMATRRFQDDITSHSYSSYVATLLNATSLGATKYCPGKDGGFVTCFTDEEALFIDNALVAWKGTQRQFERGLYLLKSIDISSNKLYGKLPSEMTNLRALISFNISNNKLYGEIPKHIDQLRYLDTFDLSRNEFSGNIPSSLSQLTLLSYLNLSYNNLSGRIPTGTQLQSFGYTSYSGNPQLCGPPLIQICGPSPPPAIVVGKKDAEKDGDEFWKSYYTGIGTGFVVGFWGICGVLFLNHQCRYFLFASLNSMKDWIHITTALHFQSLHKKFRW